MGEKMYFLTNLVIIVQRENDSTLVLIFKRRAEDILLRNNKKKKKNCSEESIKGSYVCLQSSTINGSLGQMFWGRWNQRYRQLRLSGIITHTHTHTHTLKLQFLCILFSNRVEKIIQICQQQFHSWEYTLVRSSCTCVSEDRYKDVHTFIVCTSRKQEIIQMFTDSKQESTLLYSILWDRVGNIKQKWKWTRAAQSKIDLEIWV